MDSQFQANVPLVKIQPNHWVNFNTSSTGIVRPSSAIYLGMMSLQKPWFPGLGCSEVVILHLEITLNKPRESHHPRTLGRKRSHCCHWLRLSLLLAICHENLPVDWGWLMQQIHGDFKRSLFWGVCHITSNYSCFSDVTQWDVTRGHLRNAFLRSKRSFESSELCVHLDDSLHAASGWPERRSSQQV